ncbi:carboxymuconolactone decarboxylase family protein [Halogeometricum borinquense]|uniref:Carboxymuconolactone decarboxylase family protein n=1 Tax=Halogeometricum borinquense TaxID=60847 RepID=A0A6C0UKH9_9EURY|nr:carboxymuconolactone decarboxylase family protein [Halogeometricum borinquense]QIB75757.1 carboxymuconolactone decarboxylase family protein [Halogeometricum borinquense]QIQ75661.1 carboxymuconolactone decarboxylase family protein [Halogeometricum borinquense]
MTTVDSTEAFAGLFADSDAEPEFLTKLRAHDPDFADHVAAIARTAGTDDALSAQTKTLITLALDAADGNTNGVKDLAAVARSQGVSEQELAETVKVIANQGGLGKLAVATHALKE